MSQGVNNSWWESTRRVGPNQHSQTFSILTFNKYDQLDSINNSFNPQSGPSDNVLSIDQHMVDEPRKDDLDDLTMNDSDSFVSTGPQSLTDDASDKYNVFDFKSKGLHKCNLSVRHILPKMDEMRLILSNTNIPDIFGVCETFLGTQHLDSLILIDSFNFFSKDMTDTQMKSGGGLILYLRQSLNIKRRVDLENSNIETLWAEVNLSKSKPFLICTVYHPPSACSE